MIRICKVFLIDNLLGSLAGDVVAFGFGEVTLPGTGYDSVVEIHIPVAGK